MITRLRSLRSLLAGSLRAAVVAAAILVLALIQLLRSAEARAGEALQDFGAELLRWEASRPHSGTRRLTLNGIELRLVTASTTKSVREALDGFALRCRSRGLRDGVLRRESASEGVLACIDTGGPLALDDLAQRLAKVAKDGDLGALGNLRYVVARRSRDTTAFLFIWTEGPAPLLRAFPGKGDAPGEDPAGVPRPEASRRVLSAAEAGAPYSLTIYEAEKRPTAARATYEHVLRRQGWALSSLPQPEAFLARRGSRTVLVRVASRGVERSLITVAVLS